MPLFRITVKQSKVSNGVRLEKGMSVEVVSNSFSNPVSTNGGQSVVGWSVCGGCFQSHLWG